MKLVGDIICDFEPPRAAAGSSPNVQLDVHELSQGRGNVLTLTLALSHALSHSLTLALSLSLSLSHTHSTSHRDAPAPSISESTCHSPPANPREYMGILLLRCIFSRETLDHSRPGGPVWWVCMPYSLAWLRGSRAVASVRRAGVPRSEETPPPLTTTKGPSV